MGRLNKLFFQKLAMAFIAAAVAATITAWQGLSQQPDFHFTRAVVIGLVTGAVTAGVRAVIAISPLNIVPSDAQHSVLGGPPE